MAVIAFDLDGTLINSIEGILQSIDYSCNNNNLKKISREILKENIGPPINKYLPNLLGITSKDIVWENFVKDFRKHHDNIGFKKYILYPYAKQVLFEIFNNTNNIYIVSNKPYFITMKTLNYFNILSVFNDIYTLDNSKDKIETWPKDIKRNKVNYLNFIDKRHKNEVKYFIGDRKNDLLATCNNSFNFIYAKYGYGKYLDIKKPNSSIQSLIDLKKIYKNS
tara:strand:+ start:791 stop:1456 length:666 start_codon:yes stop_codon:yes gene_type:complete